MTAPDLHRISLDPHAATVDHDTDAPVGSTANDGLSDRDPAPIDRADRPTLPIVVQHDFRGHDFFDNVLAGGWTLRLGKSLAASC